MKKYHGEHYMMTDNIYNFVQLDFSNIGEIHKLISNHYVSNDVIHVHYSKEYIYWIMKKIKLNHSVPSKTPGVTSKEEESGLALGLTIGNKLIGFVCGYSIKTISFNATSNETVIQNPIYITLFCVQGPARDLGIGKNLMIEFIRRASNKGYTHAIYCSGENLMKHQKIIPNGEILNKIISEKNKLNQHYDSHSPINHQMQNQTNNQINIQSLFIPRISYKFFSIPVDCEFLDEVQFIPPFKPSDYDSYVNRINLLHLIKKKDYYELCTLLNGDAIRNKAYSQYFDADSFASFFEPTKNIVYSYLIKNEEKITDFISVYIYVFEFNKGHPHEGKRINIAHLYYHSVNTLSFNQIMIMLIEKLQLLNIHLLIYTLTPLTENITINRISMTNDVFYYIAGNEQISTNAIINDPSRFNFHGL
jgi:hypothetical protein